MRGFGVFKWLLKTCQVVCLLEFVLLNSVDAKAIRLKFTPSIRSLQPYAKEHFSETSFNNERYFKDMNRDGLADLVSVSRNNGDIELFLQKPNGEFDKGIQIFRQMFPISETEERLLFPTHILLRDWNRDGIMDVAAIANSCNVIFFILQNRILQFAVSHINYIGSWDASDIDGDGYLDIITISENDMGILWGKDNLQFEPNWYRNIFQDYEKANICNAWGEGVCARDFDSDGYIDIGVSTSSENYTILYGCGKRTFSRPVTLFPKYTASFLSSFNTLIDLNRDGRLDLLASRIFRAHEAIIWNRGSRNFEYEKIGDANDLIRDGWIVSDINKDGFDDVIGLKDYVEKPWVQIRYGPYEGGFQNVQDVFSERGSALGIDVGDFNKDERPDIAVILGKPPRILLLENQGDLSTPNPLSPQTILVPEEAPSLEEALRISFPGDVISLASDTYHHSESIVIRNASVTIQGREPHDRIRFKSCIEPFQDNQSVFWLENSDVTFKRVGIQACYVYPAITAVNSSVVIQDCTMIGNDRIPSRDSLSTEAQSTLIWKDSSHKNCRLIDAKITGGVGINSTDGPAMQIVNGDNLFLSLERSIISGKDGSKPDGYHLRSYPGGIGLFIKNCKSINIEMTQGTLIGGKGGNAGLFSTPGPPHPPSYSPALIGGSGLYAEKSTINVRNSNIRGGDSGNGGDYIHSPYDYWTYETTYFFSDGANGAVGLKAINHSRIILMHTILHAGEGGVPNGSPGNPYEVDETSVVEFTTDTPIADWPLY